MGAGLRWTFAIACGVVVANLYFAQPLIGLIGPSLGMSTAVAGLVVTLTQLGYGLGLLLVVPLGDRLENRRLVLVLVLLDVVALLGTAFATSPLPFLLASLGVGIGSVAVQVLVPFASHLAPEAVRGRTVGSVMSGLMTGIMLARPVASLVAYLGSWHLVFLLSAVVLLGLAAVLRATLPVRVPGPGLPYGRLLASMGLLVGTVPLLRRRSLYQACLFGSFSLFWTIVPLRLSGPDFGLSQRGIGLFALAGAAGAVVAPLAGRAADRGWTRPATGFAMMLAVAAFGLALLAPGGLPGVLVLAASAVLLDAGVSLNLILSQRGLFVLGPEYRSRLNGIFMATFFVGGAAGSALGSWAFATGGWPLTAGLGLMMPCLALLGFATEFRRG